MSSGGFARFARKAPPPKPSHGGDAKEGGSENQAPHDGSQGPSKESTSGFGFGASWDTPTENFGFGGDSTRDFFGGGFGEATEVRTASSFASMWKTCHH